MYNKVRDWINFLGEKLEKNTRIKNYLVTSIAASIILAPNIVSTTMVMADDSSIDNVGIEKADNKTDTSSEAPMSRKWTKNSE